MRTGSQRGSIVAIASVVLAGLVIIAGLTIIVVQRALGVSGQQRSATQALTAAEAGVTAAARFLQPRIAPGTNWTAYVAPPDGGGNPVGITPPAPDLVGNGLGPGVPGNPFTAEAYAWYEVTLFNNKSDGGYAVGEDHDAVIIVRSTGHGPDGSRVVLEVEVAGTTSAEPITQRSWRQILD